METGIYVPREALARASKRAAELRMSPTEFVAKALTHYLAYQDSLNLTHDIDEILAPIDSQQDTITSTAA
jgi:hypothetical protein